MFKTSIASTPLTTDAANNYFRNIDGERFGNDNSFLATLRALVAPRMKDGESIHLRFGRSSYSSSQISNASVDAAARAICNAYDLGDASNQVVIHSFTADQESNLANMRVIEKLPACYPGYHQLDKVKAFYRKSFNVDCYINPERKNVILFVDNLDNKKLHYLQVSILAFLPWYFNPEDGVSDIEMQLIYSLRESSPDKYQDCLSKIAEQYDFRTARIRQLLSGFETRYEKIERDKVRNSIAATDDKINQFNNEIGRLFGQRNELCIKLMGLERKIEEGGEGSEIMEYFLCNNRLVLEEVTDTDMYFCVKDYLTYFDREMAEQYINNERSFVYNGRHGASAEKMKKLMWELFVSEEPRLRIKVCAAYRFNLNGNVGTQGRHNFSYEFSDCMPNPHIDRWNCIGNYERTINQLLMNRDYIGALEQCVASCKSLNWGDSTVMGTFMNTMWNSDDGYNNRCIELPDGRVVKPAEAIKWLEQQEAENEQTTEEAQDE